MDGFGELIAGTGDILGIDGFEPDAGGVCILVSEEAQITVVHCPEAGGMVLLTATLMQVPGDGGRTLLDALDANRRPGETRGAAVSLDPDDDTLVLSMYLPLDGLTPRSFVARIEEFSSALVSLRSSLGGQPRRPAAEDGDGTGGPQAGSVETVDMEDLAVELRRNDGDGATVASADLGEAPDDPSLAREMLEANHLFSGTAGAVLSRDAETGRVRLRQTLYPHGGGEDDWLPRRLAVFSDKACEWKSRLGNAGAPHAEPMPFADGFMQV